MHSMYAKLFSRIVHSSLMEEPVEARYCFIMLIAIADQHGDVIGTDTAIARSINIPIEAFTRSIAILMEPDPGSNSKDHEGRRVIASENGRGYFVVNYKAYRSIKSDDEKRAYMREYMRKRRNPPAVNDVTSVKICKPRVVNVTHAEAEAEAEKTPLPPQAGELDLSLKRENPKAIALRALASRIGSWFNRRESTEWSPREKAALQTTCKPAFPKPEDLDLLEWYYRDSGCLYVRKDVLTLLNNWLGELDRARSEKLNGGATGAHGKASMEGLKDRIALHPANREWVGHVEEAVTNEMRLDLARLRALLADAERRMRG